MPPKRGRGGKSSTTSSSGRPPKIRRVAAVVFDEDARKEYLTGFSKRKKARELVVRTKAIDREREEKNESRRALRTERKERAAANVRNARALYGDEEEDPTLDSPDSDSGDQPPADRVEQAYETTDLVTTVLIESFTLSRSSSPANEKSPPPGGYSSDEGGKGMKSTQASGFQSSKKRTKNKPQFRPKMTRSDKKERATGGKGKKAGFLRGNAGTKGKANKGTV